MLLRVGLNCAHIIPNALKILPCLWIRTGSAVTHVLVLQFLTMVLSSHLSFWHYYVAMASPQTYDKNPQTNAFVERIHQVIGNSIRTMELHTRKFDDITLNAILQNVAYGLRATYHSYLTASPGQLAFRRDMIINAVYLANWKDLSHRCRQQIHRNNTQENKSRIPHEYSIGDTVYIRKSNVEQKLSPLQGPFVIDMVHTKGIVTTRRSPMITERTNIRCLHSASPSL
jgi:hypothetical protein